MGANPTQAQAIVAFLVAFTLISVGLAQAIGYLWVVLGLVFLGVSAALFLKCKSWEHGTE